MLGQVIQAAMFAVIYSCYGYAYAYIGQVILGNYYSFKCLFNQLFKTRAKTERGGATLIPYQKIDDTFSRGF